MTEAQWLANVDTKCMMIALHAHNLRRTDINDRVRSEPSTRKWRLICCAMSRLVSRPEHVVAEHQEAIRRAEEWAEEWADTGLFSGYKTDTDDCWNCLTANPYDGVANFCDVPRKEHGPREAAIFHDIVGNPCRPVELLADFRCDSCGRLNPTVRFSDMQCLKCGRGIVRVVTPPCPWMTPQVLSLATAAYEQRLDDGTLDPCRLAILADALEIDSGCTEVSVLGHLRNHAMRQYTCNNRGTHSHSGKAGEILHGLLHREDPNRSHHHHDDGCSFDLIPVPHYRGCWVIDLILGKE